MSSLKDPLQEEECRISNVCRKQDVELTELGPLLDEKGEAQANAVSADVSGSDLLSGARSFTVTPCSSGMRCGPRQSRSTEQLCGFSLGVVIGVWGVRLVLQTVTALELLSDVRLCSWQGGEGPSGATACPEEEEDEDEEGVGILTLPLQAHHAMEKMEEFVYKVGTTLHAAPNA